MRDKIKNAVFQYLKGRPFMDGEDVASEITDSVMEALLKQKPLIKNGMRLYLASFEFISGENQQPFNCLFYAKSPTSLDRKIDKYLRVYYGRDGLDEVDGDCYCYLGGQVAVKNCGWEEVTDIQQVVDRLLVF